MEKEVAALQSGNFQGFLDNVQASGNSSFKYLQNTYTNKDVQNQSVSIGLAVSDSILAGHGTSRVHGGGFAGVIMCLVPLAETDNYVRYIAQYVGESNVYPMNIRAVGAVRI